MHNTIGDGALTTNISRETNYFLDFVPGFCTVAKVNVLRMFLNIGHFSASCYHKMVLIRSVLQVYILAHSYKAFSLTLL